MLQLLECRLLNNNNNNNNNNAVTNDNRFQLWSDIYVNISAETVIGVQIEAARPNIGKATFYIDNVSTSATAESMARFVAAMDIDVLGCYKADPRRTIWQRQHGISPDDRKAFRICIPKEDCERFLDPQKWPAHIAVSQWRFKKKVVSAEEQEQDLNRASSGSRSAPPNSVPTGDVPINSVPSSQQQLSPQDSSHRLNGATPQLTPNRFAVLSVDAESADMDSTTVSNHGDAAE